MTDQGEVAYVRSGHLFKRAKLDPVEDVADAFQKDKDSFLLLQPENVLAPTPLVGPNTNKGPSPDTVHNQQQLALLKEARHLITGFQERMERMEKEAAEARKEAAEAGKKAAEADKKAEQSAGVAADLTSILDEGGVILAPRILRDLGRYQATIDRDTEFECQDQDDGAVQAVISAETLEKRRRQDSGPKWQNTAFDIRNNAPETLKKWGADGLHYLDMPGDDPAMQEASSFLHSTKIPRSEAMRHFLLSSTRQQLKDIPLLHGAEKVHKVLFPGS